MKNFRTAIFGIIAVVAIFIAVKSQFKDEIKSDIPGDPVSADARAGFDRLPVKGMVTMIDLGATECVPCKMMAPRFGIRAIPTQVFLISMVWKCIGIKALWMKNPLLNN